MPANNSQLKDLQKELSKQCSPYSYTRVNAIENFKTLGEFWEEVMKFAEENGMTVEDINDPRIFSNDQRITFGGVDACDYESLKNVYGEAVIALPFNQQRIMAGNHDDASTLIAYPDVASTTYRDWLMGKLLPLVKESLLTIQKFIFICKKIIREREIQEVGNHYVS